MSKKRKISIIVFIIIMIIACIVFCFLKKINEEKSLEKNNNEIIVDSNLNKENNTNEYIIENEDIKKAWKIIEKSANYIYKYTGFTSNNIENEMKLRLAWTQIEENNEITLKDYGDYYYIEKDVVAQIMEKIFGNDISFQDTSFLLNEKIFSTGQGLPQIIYNSDKKIYTTDYEFGGQPGGIVSHKLVKTTITEDYLELYVSPIFFKFTGNELETYYAYKSFDFKTNQFNNQLVDEVIDSFNEFNTYINKLSKENILDIYKFTFKKDGESYYLYSLTK